MSPRKGEKVVPEVRQQIIAMAQRSADKRRGKKLSDEHRQKLSEVRKGRPVSEKHMQQILAMVKKSADARRGKPTSDEHRRKTSEGMKEPPGSRIIRRNGLTREFYDQQIAAGNVWCGCCKRFLSRGNFAPKLHPTNRCRPCNKATRIRWGQVNPIREKKLARKAALRYYGATPEWYEKTFAAQDGKCAVCGRHQSTINHRSLALDHCHRTGTLRGLLCTRCNIRLGWLENQTDWILAAQNYLKLYKTPLRSIRILPRLENDGEG